jgi:DNA invertase Pin-like site-specific DNA recombinase
MKTAIYVRVSTDKQSYDQQVEPCINFCLMKKWRDYDIYREVESSGKNRPVFNEVLKKARDSKYKSIVVWRFDRAWRSSRQFIMDFESLQEKGVTVCSVQEGLDPSTAMGKAMMTIIIALAELERANISEATRQRLKVLKAKGKQLGRPKGSKDKAKRNNIGYLLREAKKRGNKTLAAQLEDAKLKNIRIN